MKTIKVVNVVLSVLVLLVGSLGLRNYIINSSKYVEKNGFDYEFKEGTLELKGLNRYKYVMYIPDEVDGVDVTSISDYAFYKGGLDDVVQIGVNVHSIGNKAFHGNNIIFVRFMGGVVINPEAFDSKVEFVDADNNIIEEV